MILKELFYDNIGIARGLIVSDSGKEYNACIDYDLMRSWCSCPSFVYNPEDRCKHIIFLLGKINVDKMKPKQNLIFVETGSPTIDNLLGGGLQYGIVTAIYGEPTAGKSMFAYQMCLANIAKTGKDSIIVDTEGLRDYDIKVMLYKFMKRWNLDKDTVDKKVKIVHTAGDLKLRSIQKLSQLFGYMPTLDLSKGGRYQVKFDICAEKLTPDMLTNASMIIIDSMTQPLKTSVSSQTANLPARAQIVERLFGKFHKVAQAYNIALMVNHHASVNPATMFGRDLGKPYGGNPILYNSKYAIEFIDAPKKIQQETGFGIDARRVKLLRRPDEQTTGELHTVRLKKDYGFCDK